MYFFGFIVLFGYPFIVFTLFRRLPKAKALAITLIAGYLMLPEQLMLDLPLFPPLDKHTIPALTAFVTLLVLFYEPDEPVLRGWIPKGWIIRSLLLALVVGGYFTTQTNEDPLFVGGGVVLPGLTAYDALSVFLTTMATLLPFLLARKFLAHPEEQSMLLYVLVIATSLYCVLALYEVRMSPQLNRILYGFFPHSFFQHIRGDGFRPLVFLNHGLWLSIFLAMSTIASAAMFRIAPKDEKLKYLILTFWILGTLYLSKSLGALMIAMGLLPVVFLGRRLQLLAATIVGAVVLIYPILRGAGMVPLDEIMAWANSVDPNRAHSLEYRLLNEEVLLEKAQERPQYGWGIWGRSMIYNRFGLMTSVTDGYWIIVLGIGGWVKYIAEFGILCLPPLLMFIRKKAYKLSLETTALTLLLAANLFDLLPNATITPITWMIAGALWGRLELKSMSKEKRVEVERGPIKHTRFRPTTASPEAATLSRAQRPKAIRT